MLRITGAEVVWTPTEERGGTDITLIGPDATLDATGCVVTPGLVNAHHHLLQSAFRTLPGTRHVPMRDWLPAMRAAYERVGVDAELCAAAAAVGLTEALLCGVTTVWDHHLTWPDGEDHLGMAQATAATAMRLGSRLVFVRGTAGDDPDTAALSAEKIATHVPTGDGLVAVAVGPAGVHSDGQETFSALAEVAARHGLARRSQANEEVDVEVAATRHGRRPLDLLDEWGWLAPDVTLAHLCGVTGVEIARLAASGTSATHAPGCDIPLGWGVAPAGRLLDAGVVVGLGTSGGGSNDAGHLLADARLAMQVSPLTGRPLSAREALAMATRGSPAGDLCCWDITGPEDAGVADPVAGLLWASPGRRPRHVVVAGKTVVRDYQLMTADPRAEAVSLRNLLRAR